MQSHHLVASKQAIKGERMQPNKQNSTKGANTHTKRETKACEAKQVRKA